MNRIHAGLDHFHKARSRPFRSSCHPVHPCSNLKLGLEVNNRDRQDEQDSRRARPLSQSSFASFPFILSILSTPVQLCNSVLKSSSTLISACSTARES